MSHAREIIWGYKEGGVSRAKCGTLGTFPRLSRNGTGCLRWGKGRESPGWVEDKTLLTLEKESTKVGERALRERGENEPNYGRSEESRAANRVCGQGSS